MELVSIILLLFYGIGAWRFWTGFNRTDFSSGRVKFTLLWPVFLIGSAPYRRNFQKALKGK